MAVEINEGDILEVRLEFKDELQNRAFNILHYRLASVAVAGGGLFPGEDFAAVAGGIAEAAYDKLGPAWAGAAAASITFTGASVADIFPDDRSAQYHFTEDNPFVGDIASDPLPLQDAPTILKKTAFGARWGIGRLFYVGLPESMQAGGVMTAGGVTNVQLFADELSENFTFVSGIYTYTFTPVLYGIRPDQPNNPRITSLVSVDLSDPIIKTQRRRRPGKGI